MLMIHSKKNLKEVKITPYRSVAFLNHIEKESPAMITTKIFGKFVGDESYDDNYEINISSCDSKVKLHGKLKQPKQRANALYKIDTLISELSRLRKEMTEQFEENGLRSNL